MPGWVKIALIAGAVSVAVIFLVNNTDAGAKLVADRRR